ncbi:MAG: MmcB family DNA repair protein [Rhodospirillaceae bacterium]|nr:MmcB family DNA repair protein [Rhodospirillaceae bacterium]
METNDEQERLSGPLTGTAAPSVAPTVAPTGAAAILRGVRRHLLARGTASLSEVVLGNGRRADILAIDGAGRLLIVEIKSSRADFLSDRKWHEYRPYCDALSFAVAADFPQDLLPEDVGVLVADAYEALEVRPPPPHPLAPARRKALLLRFAALAAERLQRLEDPEAPI